MTIKDFNKNSKQIGEYWDNITKSNKPKRVRWWESPFIIKHINQIVCEKNIDGFSAGLISFLKKETNNHTFDKGISVGCGTGQKEMSLVLNGVVREFTLFELSSERIRQGTILAKKLGISDRITFRNDDAFEMNMPESVDFVYWNNSLHHMFDVEKAICWSHSILKKNGAFCMDDFIGPSRFQWSDQSLKLASRIRSILPEEYLINPYYPKKDRIIMDKNVKRPNKDTISKADPSEAADSEKILQNIKRYFPNAQIKLTGGIVYHLTLSDILYNFDEDNKYDKTLLELLMIIDELCTYIPSLESHYAIAVAFK